MAAGVPVPEIAAYSGHSVRVLIPGTKHAATGPRLAGSVDLRLACTRIDVPDCGSLGEPVETVGIEPTSAIA